MNYNQITCVKLIKIFKESGLNDYQISKKTGVSIFILKKIIYSPLCYRLRLTTFIALCDGLEISISEFFNSKEFKNLEQEIK